MANTKKSNTLKRKRGKKFVFHKPKAEGDEEKPQAKNPFEEHAKVKAYNRDAEKRESLIEEYRKLGNNS